MISIIIPLYNKEHYVKTTLDSVLSQTYQDFEIVIINDGSTDKSVDIVKDYHDERIRLINQANQGVSAARNRGIKEVKGEYVTFIDADDTWSADHLETMMSLVKEYTTYSVFCTAQHNRLINTLPLGVSVIEDACLYDYIFATGCVLLKKEVINKVGGYLEGVQLGEDRDFWLRISCYYHTVFINKETLCHPKETENNLSRIIDPTKSFPYWDWYSYNYPNKHSLYYYTTIMIIENIKALITQKRYHEALWMLKKCKGRTALLHRFRLTKTCIIGIIKNKFNLYG